jgi:hypothetical protein
VTSAVRFIIRWLSTGIFSGLAAGARHGSRQKPLKYDNQPRWFSHTDHLREPKKVTGFDVTPRNVRVTVRRPQQSRRSPVSTVDHIEALKAKHASLEHAINQENTRPHPDDDAICSLKKRKLQIKDEIARLTASSTRH